MLRRLLVARKQFATNPLLSLENSSKYLTRRMLSDAQQKHPQRTPSLQSLKQSAEDFHYIKEIITPIIKDVVRSELKAFVKKTELEKIELSTKEEIEKLAASLNKKSESKLTQRGLFTPQSSHNATTAKQKEEARNQPRLATK